MSNRDRLRVVLNERLLSRTPLRLTTRGLGRRPQWSIAVLRAESVRRISDAVAGVTHPTISVEAIEGARLVADPFLFQQDDRLHLFFEVQRFREHGHIQHAWTDDGYTWRLTGEVLSEPFHLSYPQVLEWEGQHWMLPETQGSGEVRLYRALDFPRRWAFVAVLWPEPLADTTAFVHHGQWWMLGTDKQDPNQHRLRLFWSDNLSQSWREHPESPVARDDQRIVRSAGRPITDRGRLWRLAQDGTQRYGGAVLRVPIDELSTESYLEGRPEPLLQPSGHGWVSLGTHHLDTLEREGHLVVALDGEGPAQWSRPRSRSGVPRRR